MVPLCWNSLARLESDADLNPSASAIARVVVAESAAAQFEVSVGDFEKALSHYQVALRYAPDHAGVLLDAAYLHLRRSGAARLRSICSTGPAAPTRIRRMWPNFRAGLTTE